MCASSRLMWGYHQPQRVYGGMIPYDARMNLLWSCRKTGKPTCVLAVICIARKYYFLHMFFLVNWVFSFYINLGFFSFVSQSVLRGVFIIYPPPSSRLRTGSANAFLMKYCKRPDQSIRWKHPRKAIHSCWLPLELASYWCSYQPLESNTRTISYFSPPGQTWDSQFWPPNNFIMGENNEKLS